MTGRGVNPVALTGFGNEAGMYERVRPPYPADAVAAIVEAAQLDAGSRVMDLAAGTGKLTRQLLPLGSAVVAVEPVEGMRAEFAKVLPDVPLVAGLAESLPFATARFDLVVCAQAFHWFDTALAVPEAARVLRADGVLALVWNERDERVPWVAELTRILRGSATMPYEEGVDTSAVVDATGWFDPVTRLRFEWADVLDRDVLRALVESRSYIAAMPVADRAPVLAEVDALVRDFDGPFELPYFTDVYVARRR